MSKILTYKDSGFQESLVRLIESDALRLPYGSLLDQIYQAQYWCDRLFHDVSFIVLHDNAPALGIILTQEDCQKQNLFSCYGRPSTLLYDENLTPRSLKKAEKAFRKHVNSLIFSREESKILFCDYMAGGHVNIMTDIALTHGYKAKSSFYRVIDLQLTCEEIRSQIRDSYRSLVNWGFKNLDVVVKSQHTIVEQDIEKFKQLHIKEAGGETRSADTWDTQYKQITRGEAFLVMGYDQTTLVTASLFLHSNLYCNYAVSASRRDLFDKPLGHVVLYRAIEYAKMIGCLFFEVGDVKYASHDGVEGDKKIQNISTFKRGFGGELRTRLELEK